jgi:DNA mismatch endonuclease (patch repair protein)
MSQPPKLLPRNRRDALTRSEIMSRIRSRDTAPEKRVGNELRSLGTHYRAHVASLPGTPDFANKSRRWALFVHGCFWHSHKGCHLASTPKSNLAYWRPKLERNLERDYENLQALKRLGFRVQVIWECEIKSRPLKKRLKRFLSE